MVDANFGDLRDRFPDWISYSTSYRHLIRGIFTSLPVGDHDLQASAET